MPKPVHPFLKWVYPLKLEEETRLYQPRGKSGVWIDISPIR